MKIVGVLNIDFKENALLQKGNAFFIGIAKKI